MQGTSTCYVQILAIARKILPKPRPGKNVVNVIFSLVFCLLSHTKRGIIGGGTRCIVKPIIAQIYSNHNFPFKIKLKNR